MAGSGQAVRAQPCFFTHLSTSALAWLTTSRRSPLNTRARISRPTAFRGLSVLSRAGSIYSLWQCCTALWMADEWPREGSGSEHASLDCERSPSIVVLTECRECTTRDTEAVYSYIAVCSITGPCRTHVRQAVVWW